MCGRESVGDYGGGFVNREWSGVGHGGVGWERCCLKSQSHRGVDRRGGTIAGVAKPIVPPISDLVPAVMQVSRGGSRCSMSTKYKFDVVEV